MSGGDQEEESPLIPHVLPLSSVEIIHLMQMQRTEAACFGAWETQLPDRS